MELGEKVVGTKRSHNALVKGAPLQKGIPFSMGDVPCEVLPAKLRPSRGSPPRSGQLRGTGTDPVSQGYGAFALEEE